MKYNQVQLLIRDSNAKSKATRQLLVNIDHWKATLKSFEYQGLSSSAKTKLDHDAMQAIKKDHLDALAVEKDRIMNEIDLLAQKYNRDYETNLTKNAFNLINFERKCRAMTDKEILREVGRMQSSQGTDPALIDILSATLSDRGMTDEHEVLRDIALKNRYEQPYLSTDLGKHLQHELALVDPVSGGGLRVEDPNGQIMSFTYSDLLDDDDEPEEEGDDESL